jgi:hypothetical protein
MQKQNLFNGKRKSSQKEATPFWGMASFFSQAAAIRTA